MHSCIGCSCGTWDVFPNDLFALPWSSLAGDCFSSNVVSLGKFKGQLKAKEQIKESVESESFSTFDCIVHSPLGIIYWLSCGTFHSGISLPLSNMRHIFGHTFFQSLHEVSAYIVQGGRSCAKAQRALARVAEVAREHGWHPPKSLDWDENFKPEHTLFCRKLRFVAIYALFFGDLWA